MIISTLLNKNFRNHKNIKIVFDDKLTILVGANGSGKTNALEAIYFLSTGGSWRTEDAGEIVNFAAEVAHVMGEIEVGKRDREELRITLTRGVVGGKRVAKVKYLADGVSKRKSDFVGRLQAVLFEPESLEIVIGEPNSRREFLNEVLSQTDRQYVESLSVYQRALRSRNRLLDAIREGKSRIEVLEYWERALVKHGTIIQNRRQQLVDWMSDQLATLAIKGVTLQGSTLKGYTFLVRYEPSAVSEGRLEQYRQQEIAAGHTFVGPQRDELLIISDSGTVPGSLVTQSSRLLSSFGSRGEQRMAVLQLKLLEAKWIEEQTGDSPVMLLDDIFSELDEEHEKMVGKLVNGRQAIMTATEIHPGHYPEAKIVTLV